MMRLFDGGRVPNARRVRIFLAEKGVTLPLVPVDLAKKDHYADDFARMNPLRRVPVLELDDGSILTESVAICRYLEALHPEPNLFGTTGLEQARIEMANRRAEFEVYIPVQAAFRHCHPGMAGFEVPQVAAWGEANRPRAIAAMKLFDATLKDQEFIAGDRFSVADITLFISTAILKPAGLALPEDCPNLLRWHAAVSARPSANA